MTIEQIRIRNWQKARLLGFSMNTSIMTTTEKANYDMAMEWLSILKQDWDKSTEELVGHPLPPYKCNWCGKRGDTEHLVTDTNGVLQNYCSKHYKELLKSKEDE